MMIFWAQKWLKKYVKWDAKLEVKLDIKLDANVDVKEDVKQDDILGTNMDTKICKMGCKIRSKTRHKNIYKTRCNIKKQIQWFPPFDQTTEHYTFAWNPWTSQNICVWQAFNDFIKIVLNNNYLQYEHFEHFLGEQYAP